MSDSFPPEFAGAGRATVACRPAEVDLLPEGKGGLRGVIDRMAYLGETVDYIVTVGDVEIRIQKGRREPRFEAGIACSLAFPKPTWYE